MTAPGWYPSEGQLRWWDGERWTEHYAPLTGARQLPATAVTAVQAPAKKKMSMAKKVGIGAGAFVGLALIGSLFSGGGSTSSATLVTSEQTSTSTAPAATKTATKAAPKAAPTSRAVPADTGTTSQQNALRSAESYISYKGFSRLGLIDQLSSEYGDGFSKADATWAVDHLDGIDWNEQAVKAGRSYLDMKGFSRSGLIQQLSSPYGDQFTKAQATHAADVLGLH